MFPASFPESASKFPLLGSALLISILTSSSPLAAAEVSELMPLPEDYTSMWWAEGFPHVVAGAPWLRTIQTGHYTMTLDTEAMKITHLGPVAKGTDYESFVKSAPVPPEKATPVDLHLGITVNGKSYRCTSGGKWTRYEGPRLVESGRFFQKGDVTDLVFTAEDGTVLNAKTRFETSAWPERLGLIFAAKPGELPIAGGETSFGKIGGGFGFDGKADLSIPHEASLDTEQFTLGFWAFIPLSYTHQDGASPWLVCKNRNESHDGNYGMLLRQGKPEARLNIGGGKGGQFVVTSNNEVKRDQWNHLVMSYDGKVLRLFLNGRNVGEQEIGKVRKPGADPLVFGRRADSDNGIYFFRGVMDEIQYFNSAIDPKLIARMGNQPGAPLPGIQPAHTWGFKADGMASATMPLEKWNTASMEVRVSAEGGALSLAKSGELPTADSEWKQVGLAMFPATFEQAPETSFIGVKVTEKSKGGERPVTFDAAQGCHLIDLNGVRAQPPANGDKNDAIERYKLVLANPTDHLEVANLKFIKDSGGYSVTGVSAMLRDTAGNPTGIPVQISKNWHNDEEAGVYSGSWLHTLTQLRLPPGSTTELELVISYAHWGGVAAASHAQLCLIGWGSNQHWSESALGSWGESICYEPEQGQANTTVTDVRPVMVNGGKDDKKWEWTSNVGGADFFRFFDPTGKRIAHSAMQTAYLKHGPCLSEVVFSGRLGEGIRHTSTVSLARTDDIVRGVYHLRMDVDNAMDFSRFVIFQVGSDTYNFTQEKKMAVGNADGLQKEWNTTWGGNTYRTEPLELGGLAPWISLHEGSSFGNHEVKGAWANRGIVVRSWKAKLGGKDASAWMAEHGVKRGSSETSTADFVPPPGVTRLEPGDYIEATFEHIVMPQSAEEYYGPNEALRAALAKDGNTWRMIQRESAGNNLEVNVSQGTLDRTQPDVRVTATATGADLTIKGGLAYLPVTFTGLPASTGYELLVDGKAPAQAIHGNDFWQTDFDPVTKTWSRTYNLPTTAGQPLNISLKQTP
ncbi:MAG: LamG domain-containing protein [Akkermansiaceae bacterium]|nr:LamG domain-containing protein [Akkermansiaceae bacterium]